MLFENLGPIGTDERSECLLKIVTVDGPHPADDEMNVRMERLVFFCQFCDFFPADDELFAFFPVL